MLAVTDFIGHTVKVWEKSPETLPEFEKTYTSDEQELREENFQQFQQKLEVLKSRENVRSLRNEDPGQSFFPYFKAFLKNVFGIGRWLSRGRPADA